MRPGLAAAAAAISSMLALAGCGGQYSGATVAQQVQSWTATSPDPKFSAAISELQRDMRGAAQADSSNDATLLRTVCDVLVTDALSANQNLPTPDEDLTTLLSGAYASAVSAGQDCFCAAGGRPCPRGSTDKTVLMARFDRQSSDARRGFIEAMARVDMFLEIAKEQGT